MIEYWTIFAKKIQNNEKWNIFKKLGQALGNLGKPLTSGIS